ncbi:beta-glucosidase [Filimonas zeae]|uniref:beta-glucosidase n=1 Tax=Filimonas zeae TaxID=1737353 RepID=A0A917IPU1_9BACT|nr:glycoside hydrolase family 3 N-terminal domain-containing protein [Filimonas zeae]MDR6337545.1 beta-glucosidase [Filimonas zeae]GGH59132.1 glycosyl hydrolase [Filimonas zeae]
MLLRKFYLLLTAGLLTGFAYSQKKQDGSAMYKNAALPVETRVKDLLKRMTVEEKAGQLNQLTGGAFTGPALNDAGQQAKMQMVRDGKVGSMLNVIGATETKAIQTIAIEDSRLGIPLLFGYDVIHGYKTIFPIPLAEACSWNLNNIEKNTGVAAREAASAGIHWTFAPMCDVGNDIRWGRVMEGAGEDPWYAGLVSAARVKGFQGNLDEQHVLACVKHFAAYGAVEAGREYNYTDVSRVALWNKYLPPYEAAVKAGAASVMNGFNTFEGVPVSGSHYLVTDVLKKKWGFTGFLVSDWASFGEMITWGYAADAADAAAKALQAGSMMDMEARVMIAHLPELLKQGKVTVHQLDEAVGRILEAKFKLGLFDNPYKYCDVNREKATLFTAANRQQALQAAQEAVVLLKNNNKVLPISNKSARIAVVGHYADSKEDLFDFWIAQGEFKSAVTLLEGVRKVWGAEQVSFAAGYRADATTDDKLIAEAIANAAKSDVVLVNIGLSGKMAGEDRSLANPVVPEAQVQLLKALKATGKPVIAVVSAGRPLVLTAVEELADAIVYGWILGTESGNALANILSGVANPTGKTVMSFPYAVGQIPVYYNHFNTGRPVQTDGQGNWYSRYRDIPREPLYPFGFGLSYTSFQYSNLQLSSALTDKGKVVTATVTVSNTGDREGEEVVQWYIRDYAAAVIRPVKELKGFEKVSLKPGESKQISWKVDDKVLSFYDASGNLVLESGKFTVYAGGNSRDVLEASLEVR